MNLLNFIRRFLNKELTKTQEEIIETLTHKCRVCGRPIYSHESILFGVGGVCRKKLKMKKIQIKGQMYLIEIDEAKGEDYSV